VNISFTTYKLESGDWAFDHEHLNTVEEPLCNGTELVLNQYFEIDMNRPAVPGDQIEIIASTEDFKNSTTVLSLQSSEEEGSTYLDMVLFEEVWLCPWLHSDFGHVPSELYVQLTAVNPGRIAYEKRMRTGINPFRKYMNRNDEIDKILDEFTEEELIEFVDSSYLNGGRL